MVLIPVLLLAAADFVRDVQPILRKNCVGCHGPAMQQSGFRVDDRDAALRGGYSGKVIVPGNSGGSALIDRVLGAKGLKAMPPVGKRLTEAEVGVLRDWIDQGASWPATAAAANVRKSSHWSFQKIERPKLPLPEANPIDAFVLARLRQEAIAPSTEASKATLIRRVSLDLTGLPPAPRDLNDGYERVVERLLNSPHFGEKWARPWLDAARYADSDGYEKDWVRPYAWRWRQWVIDALNANMPFDRFTIEQIAGDLVPGADAESRVATGFHRNTMTNREGGVDSEQFRFENVVDRSVTVATTWLGLTLGCAQCHDHKYDPLSQKDFYTMFAFFDNSEEVDIDAPMPGETGSWLRKRDEFRKKRQDLIGQYKVRELMPDWETNMLRASAEPGKRTDWDLAWDCLLKLTEGGDGEKIMKKAPATRTAREWDILTDHFIRNYHFAIGSAKWKELKLDELDRKLRELKDQYPQLSQAQTLAEADVRRVSHLRIRGNYKSLGILVEPGVPASLARLSGPATRMDLAKWLVSRENPLTARVAVNRIWQDYFGKGIVETAEDFGTQGARPTHPELLDWLAAEFMESGWDVKRIHRLIVTSKTYRQSSKARPDLEAKDPNNALLARQSRVRLSAELIRDAALSVSGLLYPAVGGKSIRPPQPKGVTEIGYAGGTKWAESEGPERYRRGLYIHFQRTTPYPLLANFDAPKSTVSACRRGRSNTPLQALNLLNDPVFLEAAAALAERIRHEDSFEKALTKGYLLALAREPSGAETARLKQYFESQGKDWTGLASVLLNLDEFIVRE